MYAHGSSLCVNIESTILKVVSISPHAQSYVAACKSVPESRENKIFVAGALNDSSENTRIRFFYYNSIKVV